MKLFFLIDYPREDPLINLGWASQGWENPFRRNVISFYYSGTTITVSPTGGDDAPTIQKALDALSQPKLVKISIERKWRFPWQKAPKLIKVVSQNRLGLLEGNFSFLSTLQLPSNLIFDGERSKIISPLDAVLELKPNAENVFVCNCHIFPLTLQ